MNRWRRTVAMTGVFSVLTVSGGYWGLVKPLGELNGQLAQMNQSLTQIGNDINWITGDLAKNMADDTEQMSRDLAELKEIVKTFEISPLALFRTEPSEDRFAPYKTGERERPPPEPLPSPPPPPSSQ